MNVNVPSSSMVCECTAYRFQTGLFISGTLVTYVLTYSETPEYLICLFQFYLILDYFSSSIYIILIKTTLIDNFLHFYIFKKHHMV